MSKKTMIWTAVASVFVLGLVLPASAGSAASSAGGDKYLVMMPHTPEECLKALDDTAARSPKLLADMDWGCMSGDHTGYVTVKAKSEEAAKAMLPESQRAKAKVVKLNKFTQEQIKSFHTKS